jgi:hypothetical protein
MSRSAAEENAASQPRGFSSCEPLQKRDDHDPSTEIRPFRF